MTKQGLQMSVLVYNARSLLDIKRIMAFANTSTSSDFHILCITETWLTSHVPNSALFLTDFTIYTTDRAHTANSSTKYGGVLLAIRHPYSSTHLDTSDIPDCVASLVQSSPTTSPLLFCCVYSAPDGSSYRLNVSFFKHLLLLLQHYKMEHNCEHVIIAGDINLKHTDWSTMVSTETYESELLELLVQFNYQQTLANNSCMLDVFLINDTSPIIHTAVDYVDFTLSRFQEVLRPSAVLNPLTSSICSSKATSPSTNRSGLQRVLIP